MMCPLTERKGVLFSKCTLIGFTWNASTSLYGPYVMELSERLVGLSLL